MNPYLKQYKQTQINTTPKEQILVMLYDGAVRFLNQAKVGFAEKNIEKIHNNIIKVQNIITEFESALDLQNGGDFAQNLFALYEYMSKELSRANVKKEEDAKISTFASSSFLTSSVSYFVPSLTPRR